MKKTRLPARLALSILVASLVGGLNAAPYGPKGRAINWEQPDGQKLTLRVFGDDFYGRTETEDGYTVVYNPADGFYHYAEVGEQGKQLRPSGPKVGHNAPDGLAKHTDLSRERILAIVAANRTKYSLKREQLWNERVAAVRTLQSIKAQGGNLNAPLAAAASIKAAPVTGSKVGLTILAQFPNDPKTSGNDPVVFPVNRSEMVDFCNKEGYNTAGNSGSVRDYFYDQSLGALTYTQKVTPIVTLPQPRSYYNFSDYPTNRVYRDAGETGNLLIADAVAQLKSDGFDFSGLSSNTGNEVIATNLFFAGQDSGAWSYGLWPHSWDMQSPINVGTTGSPLYVTSYQVTNLPNASTRIGTFIHENGHLLLGFPDLYAYIAGWGEGVGMHCLMGAGNYLDDEKTPSPINGYFKSLVGWGKAYDLGLGDYVTKTLPSTGNVGYRLSKTGTPTEFFFVENRGSGDKWAKGSVDKGILIWHIDETIDGNGNRTGLDPHYGVALEQADGRSDLEGGLNLGDSTDAFDVSDPLFSNTSDPNSQWWDTTKSSARVKVLSSPGSSMQVQFGQIPQNTIAVLNPNGGELLYPKSTFTITWEANITGNVRIDLFKSGLLYKAITADTANNGKFAWEVPSNLPVADDYTIRISSNTNLVPTSDFSDAPFSLTNTTFPPDNVMPYGWKTPEGADAGWVVTNSQVYEGTHSLTSKSPGDGKTASVSYTSNFLPGNLSFYIKISSEVGYDYGSFAIDGVLQVLPTADSKKGLSGVKNWIFASYPISAGTHTLTWSYTKDDSYASGKDRVWLDGVSMPPTTQEITVKDKQTGLVLANGKAVTTFPDVRMGKSTEPLSFTITNRGKADLFGLKLVTKGGGADAFVLSALKQKSLKPGASTTFNVTFAPTSPGLKNATVQILSNDRNESPFVITLEGNAIGLPKISVSQPEDTVLKDGKAVTNFGYSKVGTTGNTRTYTVKNTGSAKLSELTIAKSGVNKADFVIGPPGKSKLAPGESTTFKVTFSPTAKDERVAQLHISCSYKPAGVFDVTVKGTGVPKNVAASPSLASNLMNAVLGSTSASSSQAVTASTTIDGQEYLTLTYAKSSDAVTRTVEVSPNLVDWFSGSKHTTIITDNESFRTVRDNTPVSAGQKRYIRLKSSSN